MLNLPTLVGSWSICRCEPLQAARNDAVKSYYAVLDHPRFVRSGVLSSHVQCRRTASASVWFYDDFNILIEFHEETQQPFNRKLPKLAP